MASRKQPRTVTAEIRTYAPYTCFACGAGHNSCFCTCPACNVVNQVTATRGPKATHPTVESWTGCYDLMHPSKKEWQYLFKNVDNGQQAFVVDEEIDCDTVLWGGALTVASALCKIYERYLYTSDLPKIRTLINWLREHREEHETMRLQYEAEMSEFKLWQAFCARENARTEREWSSK
jgi:hypothetical protein